MRKGHIAGIFCTTALLMSLGAPANASTEPTTPPPTQEEIEARISSIEQPAVREATQALYDAIIADGRNVLSLRTVDYEPAAGEISTRASLPSDCGMSVIVSATGGVIYNDTTTSCGTQFSSVKTNLGIKGQNPYNPFDQNTVRDVSFYNYNNTVATRGTSFACPNSNETKWFAISTGELVRNGTTYYTPSVYDETSSVNCGW